MGKEGESSALLVFPELEVRPFTERGNQHNWEVGDCDENKA